MQCHAEKYQVKGALPVRKSGAVTPNTRLCNLMVQIMSAMLQLMDLKLLKPLLLSSSQHRDDGGHTRHYTCHTG